MARLLLLTMTVALLTVHSIGIQMAAGKEETDDQIERR